MIMMAAKKDKITWITCPDCGSKIGIVISVGKAEATAAKIIHQEPETSGRMAATNSSIHARSSWNRHIPARHRGKRDHDIN